jgi:Mn-dependent DtxR family transcriptional regulator
MQRERDMPLSSEEQTVLLAMELSEWERIGVIALNSKLGRHSAAIALRKLRQKGLVELRPFWRFARRIFNDDYARLTEEGKMLAQKLREQ